MFAASRSISRQPQVQVIVVDAGSSDKTVQMARKCGADHVIVSDKRGRAAQMNRGARFKAVQYSDILLFLHADSVLPRDYLDQVANVFPDHSETKGRTEPSVSLGAFQLQIRGNLRGIRFVEFFANLRSKVLGMPYGDQALFLRRETFHKVGGYQELALLEDVRLVTQARKLGQLRICSSSVSVSDRRWRVLGVLQTTLLNQCIIVGDALGMSSDMLAKWYRESYRKALVTNQESS